MPTCCSRARTTASAAAENIIRSFEAELSFYGQIFGFAPADAIEPVKVEFLDTAGSAAPGGVATG